MNQDLSGSRCIKRTGEFMTRGDSLVPLMHHDPGKSWITDRDPDHPKGTHPYSDWVNTEIQSFDWFTFLKSSEWS